MTDDDPHGVDPTKLLDALHPVFLVGETYTRNILAASFRDSEPSWRVVIGMNGKWNHGANDKLLLMLSADNAVAVAHSLIRAAVACGPDEAVVRELEELVRALGE